MLTRATNSVKPAPAAQKQSPQKRAKIVQLLLRSGLLSSGPVEPLGRQRPRLLRALPGIRIRGAGPVRSRLRRRRRIHPVRENRATGATCCVTVTMTVAASAVTPRVCGHIRHGNDENGNREYRCFLRGHKPTFFQSAGFESLRAQLRPLNLRLPYTRCSTLTFAIYCYAATGSICRYRFGSRSSGCSRPRSSMARLSSA